MNRALSLIGLALTVIYGLVVIWLTWGRLCLLQTMGLNEVGDFLAGVFGPLAILWLILGYFQQGRELNAQASELRASVQQQQKQAAMAEKQLEAIWAGHRYQALRDDSQAMPNFVLSATGSFVGDVLHMSITLRNAGAAVTNVNISTTAGNVTRLKDPVPRFDDGDYWSIVESIVELEGKQGEVVFDINYLLSTGSTAFEEYVIDVRPPSDASRSCVIDVHERGRGVVNSALDSIRGQ